MKAAATSAALAAAALAHAWLSAGYLLWPLATLLATSAVLAAHSPIAVNRRMAFLAHIQAHTLLVAGLAALLTAHALRLDGAEATLAAAYMAAQNLAVLAVARLGFREDVATGLVASAQTAATVALLYQASSAAGPRSPLNLLLGEYVLIGQADFLRALPLLALSALYPALRGVRHLYAAMDPHYAAAAGIRASDAAYIASMSIAVTAALQAMGALMPPILLLVPGAIAARATPRLTQQIPTAVSAAVASAAAAHFLYTAVPQLWPAAALATALFAVLALHLRRR